ncbi:LacI family DNA-binding transcriptional regulator [Cellulosimicrobium sp. E-16]|uniref:LacI family DNA-binding transcriptional regulator n=1 Tax=Cellulosimicrobium sp. E-16 TaxID=3404049 RepID=UPI003CF44F0D
MPGPTLSEVARDAGVSLATASRAINGSANRTVRPDLRERVLASARRLGYSPDPSAQAMARGRTTSVGLVVHDIADPYFSSLAAGVADAADRDGLIVTLTSTRHSPERERAFVELMDRQRARAVVLGGGRLADDADGALRGALERYRASGGGVSLVGQPLGDLPAVAIANADGAADLARALHGLGYRAFGVLAGPAGHRTALDRARGFTEALAALGSPVAGEAVVECAFTRDGGHGGMRALLDRLGPERPEAGTPPVAVFAVNDVMAVGAMAAAREAGLRVPEDVAVAGFDDIVTLRDVTPALTTVRIPLTEVGEQALALALAPLDDDSEPRRVEVRGEVVLRESTPRL